jgi:hypothetical protein
MRRFTKLLVMGVISLALLSCGLFNFSRNGDGTYAVETNLPLHIIQTALENAADFSNIVDMQLELREGYIFVRAAQLEFQGIQAHDVSFHLEMGSSNGQLTAAITNLQISNKNFDDAAIEPYNQILAERLAQATRQGEQARLESVSISPVGVKMVWLIDPGVSSN